MTDNSETNVVDTLQSLIVAFALAMTVRSFVTEGFVIPTGSMAPTLLGAHIRWQSPITGYGFAADAGPILEHLKMAGSQGQGTAMRVPRALWDPMLSVTQPVLARSTGELYDSIRMGDRVLVLKFLYAFLDPQRWDVVVFKNPTDPVGDTQNYIKRLVGLPNEQLLLIDGDVWTAPLGAPLKDFHVERKPEHVQRAVWQPVYDSDFIPTDMQKLQAAFKRAWEGPPWIGDGWDLTTRIYRWPQSTATELRWAEAKRHINDWNAYNLWRPNVINYAVSDLRVAAMIEADSPEALTTEFRMTARGHVFTWAIGGGKATLSIRHMESQELVAQKEFSFPTPSRGAPCEVEFWHVDQCMGLWLNGTELGSLPYDSWTPEDRIRFSFFGRTVEQYAQDPVATQPPPPEIAWKFDGSAVSLHRVRLDRDLYYRPAFLNPGDQFETNGEHVVGLAFATDIGHPAQLKADQFLMLGDNSAASRDGRMWGRPHPIVTQELGVSDPFVVPRDLLLGKAWCVYFPAPLPVVYPDGTEGKAIVPDFGSLRFIR